MSSKAKAGMGSLYLNAWEEIYIRQMLEQMGNFLPVTYMQMHNSTVQSIVNSKT